MGDPRFSQPSSQRFSLLDKALVDLREQFPFEQQDMDDQQTFHGQLDGQHVQFFQLGDLHVQSFGLL